MTQPADAPVSDDGHWWWDGTTWHPTNAEVAEVAVEQTTQAVAATLGSQASHGQGELGISADGAYVVIRQRGKNLLTRKHTVKDELHSLSSITRVLVISRDRTTYAVEMYRQDGKRAARVEDCSSKSELDTLMTAIAAAATNVTIELAHPSHGLSDPHVEHVKAERKRAQAFNKHEAEARANSDKNEVKVKTYDDPKDYARDAKRMAASGWMPEGQSSGRGGVSAGGTAAKLVLTGGLGAITGFSRKGGKTTVTWVRQLPHHDPEPFHDVPDVPEPRSFAPEPYSTAVLTEPVMPGHEFPPVDGGDEAVPATAGAMAAAPPDAGRAAAEAASPPQTNQESDDAVTPNASPTTPGIAALMRELSEMKESGLITEDEFAAKRAELLARM